MDTLLQFVVNMKTIEIYQPKLRNYDSILRLNKSLRGDTDVVMGELDGPHNCFYFKAFRRLQQQMDRQNHSEMDNVLFSLCQ